MTTRYRERDSLTYGTYSKVDVDAFTGKVTTTNYTTGVGVSGKRETILDEVTPLYKKKSANGEVVMGGLTQTLIARHCIPAVWTFPWIPGWGSAEFNGDMASKVAILLPAVLTPALDAQAILAKADTLTTAHAKINDSTAMVLVSLAEARKTAEMLKSPFDRSHGLITSLIDRRNFYALKKGMKYTDAAIKAYLEVRFGWQPVIYDLQTIAKAYSMPDGKPLRQVARSSWKKSEDFNHAYSLTFPGTTGVHGNQQATTSYKVASGVLYERTETIDEKRARAYGYRLRDVPAAMYELVPFSFVLDRFYSVGNWLTAILPDTSVKILGSWTTTCKSFVSTFTVDDVWVTAGSPLVTNHTAGGTFVEISTSKTRIANPALPSLPPTNVGDLSVLQLVDHAALIAQVLKTFDVRNLRKWETYAPKRRWISLYRAHPTL